MPSARPSFAAVWCPGRRPTESCGGGVKRGARVPSVADEAEAEAGGVAGRSLLLLLLLLASGVLYSSSIMALPPLDPEL